MVRRHSRLVELVICRCVGYFPLSALSLWPWQVKPRPPLLPLSRPWRNHLSKHFQIPSFFVCIIFKKQFETSRVYICFSLNKFWIGNQLVHYTLINGLLCIFIALVFSVPSLNGRFVAWNDLQPWKEGKTISCWSVDEDFRDICINYAAAPVALYLPAFVFCYLVSGRRPRGPTSHQRRGTCFTTRWPWQSLARSKPFGNKSPKSPRWDLTDHAKTKIWKMRLANGISFASFWPRYRRELIHLSAIFGGKRKFHLNRSAWHVTKRDVHLSICILYEI